jgi:hypothetical protein
MNLSKNSKGTKRTGGEKDWFHLLLEIERRFRAEERKNLRSKRANRAKSNQKAITQ